jgi:hypothetical protein
MPAKPPPSQSKRRTPSKLKREITPFRLYLIGTTLLLILILVLLLIILSISLKTLYIAAAVGLLLPWFGYFAWRLANYISIRDPDVYFVGWFFSILGKATYILLISLFWAIALRLGYQCNIGIDHVSDN